MLSVPDPPGEIIRAGKAAWERLSDRSRATWQDWLVVGHALVIGRAESMQKAETNRPFGLKYSRSMRQWLIQNAFDRINDQERYRVIQCIEHLPAIEAWRDGLDDGQRQRLNNPKGVWVRWQRSTRAPAPAAPAPRRPNAGKGALGGVVAGTTEYSGRAIFWSGDAIRRAADAMRESRSTDFYVMARKALEAAIRSESDLMAILPDADRRQA